MTPESLAANGQNHDIGFALARLPCTPGQGQNPGVLFDELDLLIDPEPRGAAMNMAVDEVLLARASRPLLRVYQWAKPAVSFGYFDRWEPVAEAYPGREAVRRWTGGGVVLHGEDWTYSVIVPRDHPFARERATESYQALHSHLASAVAGGLELTPEAAEKRSQACFENPARHDLLHHGQKVAGAAQRRTRFGLLHQGSVQGITLPPGFAERFAAVLAPWSRPFSLSAQDLEKAGELAAAKYGTQAWNRRVL
jgi:lipoate-protein ligase A